MNSIEDFSIPDDDSEEEDEDDSGSSKKLWSQKAKASKDLLDLFAKPDKEESKSDSFFSSSEHAVSEAGELDKTPELDTEAPLEYLSKVEEVAISQTLAEERLIEVRELEGAQVNNENIAATNYLEAVASTGYIDEEYLSATGELGVTDEESPAKSETTLDAELPIPLPERPTSLTESKPPTPLKEAEPKRYDRSIDSNKETAGIVNYLMSRRKARVKNEASKPKVEKDLTAEVNNLKAKLASREARIRSLAKTREAAPLVMENQLSAPEIIRKSTATHELDKVKPKEIMQPVQAEIKAQTANRDELLKVASEVEVEGTKLSTIYSNNLLGEHGLRRVVAEYLKGGDVKKILRQEMIEREIDFERDPILRDLGDRSSMSQKSSSLNTLLEKSGINWNEERQVVNPNKTKSRSMLNLPLSTPKSTKRSSILLDIIMALVILALLTTLIVVLYNR